MSLGVCTEYYLGGFLLYRQVLSLHDWLHDAWVWDMPHPISGTELCHIKYPVAPGLTSSFLLRIPSPSTSFSTPSSVVELAPHLRQRNKQAHHSLIKNLIDTQHKWTCNITILRTQTTTLSASLHLKPMETLPSLFWALGTGIFCKTPRKHTCYLAWLKDNHTQKLTGSKVWERWLVSHPQ